jgi:hypothetical protein
MLIFQLCRAAARRLHQKISVIHFCALGHSGLRVLTTRQNATPRDLGSRQGVQESQVNDSKFSLAASSKQSISKYREDCRNRGTIHRGLRSFGTLRIELIQTEED